MSNLIYWLLCGLKHIAAIFRLYKPTILLSLMYIVGELHSLINWPHEQQNWILANPVPMWITWNVKQAAGQFQWILAGFMFIYYVKTPNKVNRTSMTVFLLWVIFDTFCYFYNYKTWGYLAMYAWLPVIWCVFYFWRSKLADWIWQHSKPK